MDALYLCVSRDRARKRSDDISTREGVLMKAQLILVGGRPMPNILTLIHQKPELVVAICSVESVKKEWPGLKKAIENLLPSCKIKEKVVDGYRLEQIEPACESELGKLSQEDWIFNITTATSIMSIGAYRVAARCAHQIPIRCWYLDTARSRIISLVGNGADEEIFNLEVDQYAAVYDCRLIPGSLEEEREYCQQHWLPFTHTLVDNPHSIDLLKEVVKKITNRKPKKEDGPKELDIPDTSDALYTLLTNAFEVGLLGNLKRARGRIFFSISYLQANFLEGPWLEAYVWDEAHKLDMFSDCRWNQKLVDGKKFTDKDSKNELDVSMIYKAQLFIMECKSGIKDAFDAEVLYKLDSVANPLGNQFVGKIVVTSQPIPDKNDRTKYKKFEGFKEKADERGMLLVTRETLPNIGAMLKQYAQDRIARSR
jgi:Domain of unknown function (DUF1887)